MGNFYTNERNVQIVLFLLKANGIKKVVASPGATNITVVASMQNDSFFEMYSAADERSAAYIACGLAAESGEPVVLSCTGATASRNYMPGLTEAFYRKLPLIAITSSKSSSMIAQLVAQVTDRTSPPSDVAKRSVLAGIVKDEDDEWDCMIKINQALSTLKQNGGGPIHINLETTHSDDFSVKELPKARIIKCITVYDQFPEIPSGRIGLFIGSHNRWTDEESERLDRFCASNNAVALCDHTSNYKGKYRVLFSLPLSQDNYIPKLSQFDLLIHIGEISGEYSGLNCLHVKEVWRVNEDGEIRDTFHQLTHVFDMSESSFFEHYIKWDTPMSDSFLISYKEEYGRILNKMPEIPFSNIWVAKQLAPRLPENSVLHLGILNTLRSWNFFEIPDSVLSYSNVGGFGIDGCLSTLVGASLVHKDKLYFGLFGDLAFFYDMNVVGNRHVGANLRILLINNGKGVEFRNYNHQAAQFEEAADAFIAAAGHYGNQSPELIKHYAQDLGYEYLCASTKEEFEQVVSRYLTSEITDKPILFEVFTNTEEEKKALKIVRSIESDGSMVIKKALKNAVKQTLGEKAIEQVRKTFKN
ncbi:thiamine pyrophosphate-binding protein [Bacteroides sp.]|uniref:thiamine pyrophosphate-binding protein n=1 Tax=Bacteroides sp. TaxID=29523 RepID=UPI0025B9F6F1|nr:thiamine pyrophosphate-binding protein [Bacteroides sp.]